MDAGQEAQRRWISSSADHFFYLITFFSDAGVRGGKPAVTRALALLEPLIRHFGLSPDQLTEMLDIILKGKLGTSQRLLIMYVDRHYLSLKMLTATCATFIDIRWHHNKEDDKAPLASPTCPRNVCGQGSRQPWKTIELCEPGKCLWDTLILDQENVENCIVTVPILCNSKAALIRWVILVYDIFDSRTKLQQLYGAAFHYLTYETLR